MKQTVEDLVCLVFVISFFMKISKFSSVIFCYHLSFIVCIYVIDYHFDIILELFVFLDQRLKDLVKQK